MALEAKEPAMLGLNAGSLLEELDVDGLLGVGGSGGAVADVAGDMGLTALPDEAQEAGAVMSWKSLMYFGFCHGDA